MGSGSVDAHLLNLEIDGGKQLRLGLCQFNPRAELPVHLEVAGWAPDGDYTF
jgi:hypothetical protein